MKHRRGTTSTLFRVMLYLHIMGVIIAFGPNFVFPVVGPLVEKKPEHGKFWLEATELIEHRLVLPVAISLAVTGLVMVYANKINLLGSPWLVVAILLYIAALGIATGSQLPATRKALAILESRPDGAPSGPPPAEFQALINRLKAGGAVLLLLVFVIAALMVFKPGNTAFIGS
ncbi:MAG: DUF2269 family protein [Candidatus Dormibacteria bacterium]